MKKAYSEYSLLKKKTHIQHNKDENCEKNVKMNIYLHVYTY